jgi:chemotaxis receptor (MCP) glutamine deamidase CheD
MPELTITGKTNLADIQRFAETMNQGHEIRAKTNKAGNTVLYSKDPRAFSFGLKKGLHAGKAKLAKEAIQTMIDKHAGTGTKGAVLNNLVLAHQTKPAQTFLHGSDLTAILGKAAAVEAMVDSKDSVKIDERPQVMVAMGQGAIGRLDQVQFYSDSFSSCMPMILYNIKTGVGGLFHVPSPKVNQERDSEAYTLSYRGGVRDALAEMIALVKPTDIVVKPGGDGLSELKGSTMLSVGPSALDVAGYVAKDLESIVKSQAVGSKVHFLREEPSGRVAVTASEEGGLAIANQDITCGKEINLLRSNLPSSMSDQVLTWSFVGKGDESVLVGSKF